MSLFLLVQRTATVDRNDLEDLLQGVRGVHLRLERVGSLEMASGDAVVVDIASTSRWKVSV